MSTVKKPIILDEEGIFATLADGEIINAGGTSNPTWTVDGKGLMFDDGTSTSGGQVTLSLQSIYNSSPATTPLIKLIAGKDFSIASSVDDSKFISVDSETGKVLITGDLEVLGNASVINTEIQDSDHWLISPKNGLTSALRIEPDMGVIPYVDLVSVRRTFGSAPVFRIDSSGDLLLSQNILLDGLLNGVDVVQLQSNLNDHLGGTVGSRHPASDIDVEPISTLPGANNVQEALEQLNTKIDAGGNVGAVFGYEHVQTDPALNWNIAHNGDTLRCQVTIYDDVMEQILPEQIKIVGTNNILVSFASPVAGRAIVILF